MAIRRRKAAPEGTLDKIKGRLLELVGRATGKRHASAAGKGYRARGRARQTKGRMKRGRV